MKIYEVTEQRKIAAFALGRMNPATVGHELLINAIKQAPGDSFLFLTDRAPKLPDNPLTSQDKLDWARKSFNGIAIGLAKTVLTAADRLYKMGYNEVTFLEGEPKLLKILQDYNGVEKPTHNYKFTKINYVQLSRDAAADDATGMSGTKLRGSVTSNNIDAFKSGVTKSAQPFADEMFKKLQVAMGIDATATDDVDEGIFDWFKKDKEDPNSKALKDPQYLGWKKIYKQNLDVASMHRRHKEFLKLYKSTGGA